MSAEKHGVGNGEHKASTGNNENTNTPAFTEESDMDVENGGPRKRKESNDLKMSTPQMREDILQKAISQTWVVPDGGYGWLVMVCCLMISVIVDGVTYTFGVFLRELEEAFQEPKSTITLANSLQVGIYLISGPFVSVLTNRFGCRPVIIVGSLVAGVSFVLSAFSPNITVLIVIYGFVGGIGFGMMYLPSVVAVSFYFDRKRALATGIAVCGSGIGTFILAPLTEILLMEYNWKWTLILLGGIVFHGVICGALIRPLELKLVDKTARKRLASHDDKFGSLANSIASSLNSKKTSKFSSPKSINSIPESIPLIVVTDDKQTNIVITPEPEVKNHKHENMSPGHENSKGKMPFYSSTPAFSSGVRNTASGMVTRKTSNSLSEEADQMITNPRHRSNTIDYINQRAIINVSPTNKEMKTSSRHLSHAPIGLAFIGVSDAHLNRIRDDVARPLSRRDIHRSMMQMEFGDGTTEEVPLGSSQGSLPSLMGLDDDVNKKSQGLWACLPESARETMEDMLNLEIFNDRRYWFVIAGNFLCMLGFYVPFVYIPGRASEIGVVDERAALLISIIGITNLVGRVATGVLVNYLPIDSVLVTSVALALAGLMTILCPLCETYETLIAISAIFGLCVAAYISLCSILLCELLGVQNLTNAFGYVILFRGIAVIMGPPIAGDLIDSTGQFDPAFFVGGSMIVLGAVSHLFLLMPCIRHAKSTL